MKGSVSQRWKWAGAVAVVAMAGCATAPMNASLPSGHEATRQAPGDDRGLEVAMYALGLMETGYRFGGKNPEAGLDCSGMVSYVYARAAGMTLSGSAADLARRGRPVSPKALKPGDLVFFRINDRDYAHVGIYVGDQRFIHAPSRNGKVRLDSLEKGWFASRFGEARTYLE